MAKHAAAACSSEGIVILANPCKTPRVVCKTFNQICRYIDICIYFINETREKRSQRGLIITVGVFLSD